MAEEKGFEPLRRLHDLPVFKTGPFNQTWVFLHLALFKRQIDYITIILCMSTKFMTFSWFFNIYAFLYKNSQQSVVSNFIWCLRPDLNRHEGWVSQDFKSCASTNSATQAMVTCMRFELMTLWLKVKCSTDWANRSYIKMAASVRFELTHVRVKVWCLTTWLRGKLVVERDGFEPSNSMRTDLQSVAFSLFATSPKKWCRNQDLNPEPTDYKSVALPIELFRHLNKIWWAI